ncbi:MAG TPA: hypothetical protein QF698_04540 [Candidatus Marinimicrobia bacterium]|nr:hypothetical protein [Candidatus Neomarinimicrobiota bacterium]
MIRKRQELVTVLDDTNSPQFPGEHRHRSIMYVYADSLSAI